MTPPWKIKDGKKAKSYRGILCGANNMDILAIWPQDLAEIKCLMEPIIGQSRLSILNFKSIRMKGCEYRHFKYIIFSSHILLRLVVRVSRAQSLTIQTNYAEMLHVHSFWHTVIFDRSAIKDLKLIYVKY